MVLDTSASMTSSPPRRKARAEASPWLWATSHPAATGSVWSRSSGQPRCSPAHGRLVCWAARTCAPSGADAWAPRARDALSSYRSIARARLASSCDFVGGDWSSAAAPLRGRHGLLCSEVRDPRELALPPVGSLWMVDPETGREVHVNTGSAKLRRRFADAAAEERAQVAGEIRSAGADHVLLTTDGDWLRELATHLRRTERARRTDAGRPAPGVGARDPADGSVAAYLAAAGCCRWRPALRGLQRQRSEARRLAARS